MGKRIDDYRSLPNFERKQFPSFVKQYDDEKGIVEHYIAVFGNVDEGGDRIMPGSFVKSISERGLRVKVLDQHSMDSVTRIVGKPMSLREVGRQELSAEVLNYAPDATGALLATTQYAIDTTRGLDVYRLVKGGYAPETSIGYDAIDTEYVKELGIDGKECTVRQLKTIRLWEYSNVVFGMNPATSTLSAKGKPEEGKPYAAIEEDGKWRVYKLGEDGKPTGDPLGEHDTEAEAMAQVRALYANEKEREGNNKAMTFLEAFTQEQREQNIQEQRWMMESALGESVYSIAKDESLDDTQKVEMVRQSYAQFLDAYLPWLSRALTEGYFNEYGEGMMGLTPEGETKAGRVLAARNANRIMNAMKLLHEAMADAGLMEPMEDDEDDKSKPASKNLAGPEGTPSPAPTDDAAISGLIRLIEIELDQLSLIE